MGVTIGPVAYRLRLPKELNSVHDTFHVSKLKKCLADPTLQVPLDEIKVWWNLKCGLEFTWEREDQIKLKYPHLFSSNIGWLRPLLEVSSRSPIFTVFSLGVNAPAGRLLGAYDFGVVTPRALVHAGVKTNGDARSWYMISGDAKSWFVIALHLFIVI
ncbi:hypothetical protein Tco_1315167 [Tanacetum coccineum]